MTTLKQSSPIFCSHYSSLCMWIAWSEKFRGNDYWIMKKQGEWMEISSSSSLLSCSTADCLLPAVSSGSVWFISELVQPLVPRTTRANVAKCGQQVDWVMCRCGAEMSNWLRASRGPSAITELPVRLNNCFFLKNVRRFLVLESLKTWPVIANIRWCCLRVDAGCQNTEMQQDVVDTGC